MSSGLPPAGRRDRFRVSAHDPKPVSAEQVRIDLDVPSLSRDNTFTGANSLEGQTVVEGLDVNGQLAVYGGMAVDADDPATFNKAPTVGGSALITEAPQDGGYYARRNGAWVDITAYLTGVP